MSTNIKPIVIIRIADFYDDEVFEMLNETFQEELSEHYHVISIPSDKVDEVKIELQDREVNQNLN